MSQLLNGQESFECHSAKYLYFSNVALTKFLRRLNIKRLRQKAISHKAKEEGFCFDNCSLLFKSQKLIHKIRLFHYFFFKSLVHFQNKIYKVLPNCKLKSPLVQMSYISESTNGKQLKKTALGEKFKGVFGAQEIFKCCYGLLLSQMLWPFSLQGRLVQ